MLYHITARHKKRTALTVLFRLDIFYINGLYTILIVSDYICTCVWIESELYVAPLN